MTDNVNMIIANVKIQTTQSRLNVHASEQMEKLKQALAAKQAESGGQRVQNAPSPAQQQELAQIQQEINGKKTQQTALQKTQEMIGNNALEPQINKLSSELEDLQRQEQALLAQSQANSASGPTITVELVQKAMNNLEQEFDQSMKQIAQTKIQQLKQNNMPQGAGFQQQQPLQQMNFIGQQPQQQMNFAGQQPSFQNVGQGQMNPQQNAGFESQNPGGFNPNQGGFGNQGFGASVPQQTYVINNQGFGQQPGAGFGNAPYQGPQGGFGNNQNQRNVSGFQPQNQPVGSMGFEAPGMRQPPQGYNPQNNNNQFNPN